MALVVQNVKTPQTGVVWFEVLLKSDKRFIGYCRKLHTGKDRVIYWNSSKVAREMPVEMSAEEMRKHYLLGKQVGPVECEDFEDLLVLVSKF